MYCWASSWWLLSLKYYGPFNFKKETSIFLEFLTPFNYWNKIRISSNNFSFSFIVGLF